MPVFPMFKRPARKALLCTTALFLVHAAPAGAADVTVPSGTTETTTQIIDEDGDTLTVEDGGAIDTSGTGGDGVTATADDQTVVNDGTIIGYYDGIYVSYSDDATITNNGTIEGNNYYSGIYVVSSTNATITNNGTIGGDYDGIEIYRSDDTTITNNGTIDGDDYGIDVSYSANATITNNGTIEGGDRGIEVYESDDTKITNSGTIWGDAHGIYLDESANATITNNGTIESDYDGIEVYESDDTTITNNGTIWGDNYDGIDVSYSANTTITNSGTIRGDYYAGIYVRSSDNTTITNSGTIVGLHAIYINSTSGNAIVNLLAGSVLDGEVHFLGATPALNIGNGLNLYFVYEDNNIDELTVTTPVPFVHDEINNIVYTIDPTGFALLQPFLQTTAGAVHGAVRDGTRRGNAFGGGFSGTGTFAYGLDAPGFDEDGPRGWASGFGGYQKQNGSGGTTGGNQAYGGLVTGGGFASKDRMYGAFLGGAYSRLQTDHDTQAIDAASFYGGLYGGMTSGPLWIEAAFMGGYSAFSSERTVANNTVAGGLETASADYGGYFVSPSLTVGRSLGERTEVSFGGTYAGLFIDGYTETGAQAAMTVASHAVHVAALRAEARYLAGQHRTDNGMVSVETWAGVDGFFNLGGGDVEASIAGLPVDAFSANFTDATAVGFAGIGLNHRPDNGAWSLKTALEGRYGTGAYTEIRGNASLAVRF